MDDITRKLADQRVKEFDMRLQRIDGLLDQAEKKAAQRPEQAEASAQLEDLRQQRNKLASWLDETRSTPLENWKVDEIRSHGPMGIWDAVAQQVEKLIERLER